MVKGKELRRYSYILLIMFACVLGCARAWGQTDTIRYVHPDGKYNNDGRSWATATNRLQDAINDLRDYLAQNHLTSGSVYVAAGTYVPTESTESSGGSILNTSFKIYSGIHVYGGFNPDTPESNPGDRVMVNGKKCKDNWADPNGTGTTSGDSIASQWDLRYATILTGNHTTGVPVFQFDSIRGRFNTTFPASSYHVVWFATNGQFETTNDSTKGHFRPLEHMASVDGCVISSGNASSKTTTVREHMSYGGGAYMVGNSMLKNCIVERCNATMRGGGVYLDGGGIVEFCKIMQCQSPGIGVVQGYGGGVCIDYDGQVGHCHIMSNAARCGGGLAICHIPGEYPVQERIAAHIMPEDTVQISYYSPFSSACVINNNTASAEGGGVYLADGGTINHATVTANNCISADVMYYGRRHGRSGGIYIRDCGMIFNSVFWGNKCESNNDIQFASVRQIIKEDFQVYVYHSAFMNHDISDWTGVQKEMVFSLEKNNLPIKGSSGNFPCFFNPTVDPTDWSRVSRKDSIYGPGVFMHMYPYYFPGPRLWHLTSYSALDQKGVQVTDAIQDASQWIRHAHTDYGVVTNPFEPVSTLGALVRQPDPITYALVPPQGLEARNGATEPIPTLFINPNRVGVYDSVGNFVPQEKEGSSWTVPIRDLGEALQFFRQYLVNDDGGNHHYMIPALDSAGMATGELTRYDYVQILVKEGTINTAGPGNYLDKNIRTAAVRVESHMRLYGGYPTRLEGTDTGTRNPRDYVTTITANITGIGGTRGYENNSAHVIAMVNVEHTIVDGFTLADANTHNIIHSHSAPAGGGVLVNNVSVDPEKRIDMTGNQLRNCVITNCSSPKGAAVYVNGEHKHADGTVCYAELKMVNCVIRNNMADYQGEGGTINDHGIITANGRAYIEVEHCDVVNNVGYPFKADSKQTESDDPITCSHPEHSYHSFHGFIRVNNSLIFCNGDRPLDNRGNLGTMAKVMSVFPDGQRYVFGEYNMFDEDLRLQIDSAGKVCPRGFFDPAFSYTVPDDFLPAGSSFGSSLNASLPSEKNNQAIFTRTDNTASTYPGFVNPSRNVGNSTNGDKPLYGGIVSYAPLTTNPCVNAANASYYTAVDNYDRTDNNVRSFGGDPDIGAVENTDLPLGGKVIYVTPNGAGKRDGSSWSNAIAGNTVYMLSDIAGPALADGDQIDPEATCNRVLDSEGNPRLTTDSLYCGGWGKVWIAGKTVTGKRSLTRQIHTVERKIYIGGDNDGDEIPIGEPTDTEISNSEILSTETPSDFTPGYEYDTRYPYGEISGASRSFWRANPYHDGTDWNNASAYANTGAFIAACNSNGWINNARRERYVSGLQYAVEKASAANKTAHENTVQVWVGAGTYTDYKGYVMRDSVTVMGGFPTNKYAAPGLNERQALMSDVVSIPKSKPATDFEATDYETILQLSDVNPKQDNTHLNSEAVKYWDDDYTSEEIGDIETTQIEEVTITHPFRWIASATEVSSDYIRYPDMYMAGKAGNNVFSDRHKCDKNGNNANNITMSADEVFGGYTWASGTKVVYQYFGSPWKKTDMGNNQSWELCYQDVSGNVNYSSFGFNSSRDVLNTEGYTIDSDPRGMALSGYMSTMSAWQTMKNVPAGSYKLVIDLGAYYESYPTENNTGITFYIIASNGDTLAEQPVFCNSDKLLRYEFTFVQPTIGDLTIRMMSAPGTKHATPSNDANKRKVSMSNVHLYVEGSYEYVEEPVRNDTIIASQAVVSSLSSTYTKVEANHRITLRKRVLTMPDICVPTYGAGSVGNPSVDNRGKYGDDLAHTDRVFGSTKEQRTAATSAKQEDPQYVEYNEANWDGFTIRHGFLADENMAHGGGAGVNMYEGGHLRNCLVVDNFAYCGRVKGGGMFCDGATSTIEGCFVLNNTSSKGTNNTQDQIFAGGLFMYEGTCFNSLFANNYSYGSSGGLGFCVGRFYNNTVAYNTATLKENSKISGGAVSLATASNPNLFVANTIIFGNNGVAIRDRATAVGNVNPFLHCYIQSEETQPNNATKQNVTNWTESNTNNYGIGNTFLNGVAPSAANTPFAADFDEEGNYVAGRAASLNDFRLRDDFYIADQAVCVNHGTEEFAVEFKQALTYKGKTESDINSSFVYKSVAAAKLPNNDVAFAKRVQDCQVDMGAYEFNAAYSIKPDTTTHPGQAIFYVMFDSRGGDASADSPQNAACKQKLQQVLDAAGRYKNKLMTDPAYSSVASTPVAEAPDKSWTVEVWLAGDSTNCTTSSTYADWYTPTRSTKHSDDTYMDNTLDYSFIIPHGIQVKGGYKPGYFHTEGGKIVDDRDPLTYRSVLSGKITSSTGAEGQTYHVITFTNDLFDGDENRIGNGNQLDTVFSGLADAEAHRAVVDGVFIEDGNADSPDYVDRIGAAAVVTGYAHIRNCVIQNNHAEAAGGGLYLLPKALVSGTIIKKNTADVGGGVYIVSPEGENDSIRGVNSAHVYTTTICENLAYTSAGGLWFDNTYARVNSTALWHNQANDYANVSGVFSRSESSRDYPFAYCAVESRRLEGQGNIELSARETEGVRWDRQDPFDAILYYPIEMSSTLSRAGMTYMEWYETMKKYTTLDTTDIAGVSRTRWLINNYKRNYAWGEDTLVVKNNDFIEIGARAVNKTFEIKVDPRYVMHRLYVMHTELLNSEAARALQDNTATDSLSNMYRQMGSCMLNPFHRLGDAFEYIIAARKMNPAMYRNRVFEVFIEKGTYYPYHNAYGEQDQVRNSTFLVPEAIYVIGGVNSQMEGHSYGQEGYYDQFTDYGIDAGNDSDDVVIHGHTAEKGDFTYTINYSSLDSIRVRDDSHRPMRDVNLNSVIEPWELDRQTILSGNAVSGEDFTHVYHVVTMHADPTYVGPQPYKFYRKNPDYGVAGKPDSAKMFLLKDTIPFSKPDSFHLECQESILGRTTEYDGIQVSGGYANHINEGDISHVYATKTYFRGGGILVDGNWTKDYQNFTSLPTVTKQAQYNIPIIVENCYFTNNMAANGGALYSNGGIYMFGCHFTQNYSQGPVTQFDQQYIPWSAGGCIATNATCDIANTLFDNNEAKRGLYPIPDDNTLLDDIIPDADARQGFGGVLSVAEKARLRVVNCHFMRNKAVAYPAIYNFNPNNLYQDADSMQFAFNTIFWGNEVFEVDSLSELPSKEAVPQESVNAFNTKYKGSRTGVFHYDPDEWKKYERLFSEYDSLYKEYSTPKSITDVPDTFNVKVTDKLEELRKQGQKMEGLYFCSYRKGYGPPGMKPTQEGYLLTRDEAYDKFVDPRNTPVRLAYNSFTRNYSERYDSLWYWVRGNNNVLINRINNATDGPNFRLPSLVAGVDGYMQNADWLLARMNLTTDQGWGHLTQNVERKVSYYITKFTGSEQFESLDDALTEAKNHKPDSIHVDSVYKYVYPVKGLPAASFVDTVPELAMYNFYAKRYGTYTSKVNPPLPVGNQYYMIYSRYSNEDEQVGAMDRISKNPRLGEKDVYIDVGIYEYQYVQLDIKGQEIDTMWVATVDKAARHDGLTWETPTTDLQTAIDVLMSSHNNHDKYICFLGDAEQTFSPTNILDNRRTFLITSNSLSPMMPDSALADFDYGVRSLNFLGGYSFEVKDAPRDPVANRTLIEMPGIGNQAQLNQLFVIEDMTRQLIQANYQGDYISRDSVVIPIVFDGITFSNPYSTQDNSEGGLMSKKGGAAIYYRWQRRYVSSGQGDVYTPDFNLALHPDSALIDGLKTTLPKLTLSNCIFMDNGERTADLNLRSSAVRVDHGGGSTLIVNSLFHSNAGAPVYAPHFDHVTGENDLARVPNDVIVVNSTFALNDGHLTLKSDHSEMHNSLIWRDDLAKDTADNVELVQLEMGEDIWDNTTNKNKVGIADRMTNNAVWGCFREGDETYHNDSLSTENGDVYEGPNFTKPIVDASTSEQRRQRDFTLKPSAKTMNMADTTVYRNRVFFRMYPDTAASTHNKYWRRSNGFKSVDIVALANDSDLAAKPRLFGIGMERGAYECRAVLQRVLYVNPNEPEFSAGDGSSWQHPFGTGQLQDAINAASLYTYLNRTADEETRKAYVFVKGSNAANDSLISRDGVSLYGSIPGYVNDTAWMNPDSATFTNGECQRYVNYIRSIVPGVASPGTPLPTKIRSVKSTGDDFAIGFLLDGFVITNPDSAVSNSPIILDNAGTVVRNCVIVNNKVKNGKPVADITRGLLYNSLVYNDSAEVLVKVGANGLVLNNTIVSSSEDVQTIDSTNAIANAIVNNIEGQIAELNCFAPYLAQKNAYTLPNAFVNQGDVLNFQLHERSKMVNGGREPLPATFDDYVADSVICFRRDRDVLGNPRKIGSLVDMGALEAWLVEPGTDVEITALTNEVIDTRITTADYRTLCMAFTDHYGGNAYPHAGSVVYLMDSSAMSMQYKNTEKPDFVDHREQTIVFKPAFMLLKPGASFYGNGHDVQLNYVAAEKKFVNQQYTMMSLPFDYDTTNISTIVYNAAKDSLCELKNPYPFKTYQYSGAARSAKDYVFRPENSTLWLPVDTANRTATEGYLMDFGETIADTVLRFNAFAPQLNEYVYVESADEPDKIVYLTQYDHRTPGTGSTLNFTRQEDMGWNMKGLPWLVSNYRTDTVLEGETYLRQMYIPHVFYQMDGAGEYMYLTSGDQIYTSRSWDNGSIMSMGNAFFTQTATQKEREALIFHLPYYDHNKKKDRPLIRMVSGRHQSDILTVMPDSTAGKNVQYSYGRDGIKWQANSQTAQVYLLDSKRLSKISLLGAAPTEVDIPLGVRVPEETELTFSLPEKEAFGDYSHVWLIDYALNRYTNMLNEDYTVSLEAGENNTRFAIRIGGFPKTDKNGRRQYYVFAMDGTLYVRGLVKGDKITVYSQAGQLVHTATASGSEFKMPLRYAAGYVVKVNDTAHKVVNM
ncbi:MAG: hypothetical protein IJQ20_10475 [Paludibacteraceae bacterium]|nr:hypothetical protein [Paludibacteraceae bacterium]